MNVHCKLWVPNKVLYTPQASNQRNAKLVFCLWRHQCGLMLVRPQKGLSKLKIGYTLQNLDPRAVLKWCDTIAFLDPACFMNLLKSDR